ncbi:integrase core domain-containing protein [Spiroplasma citri]|uniref:integrase core domain-containing protein n=1 Tax=Spiroplasma citri TaxID=2133 RepID=UPI0035BC2E12
MLNDKNIFHQTTPVRSPQSNGKIERFHQNYTKLFVFEEKILNAVSLQNKLNDYYFYNFERVHKSLNFQDRVKYSVGINFQKIRKR